MTTLLDLLYVALFAAALPAVDYFTDWPLGWAAFRRRIQADPATARKWLYVWGVVGAWSVVGVGVAIWLSYDRSWTSFGFSIPIGWRLWVPVVLSLLLVLYTVYAAVAVAVQSQARASVRQQFGEYVDVLPHTQAEMCGFAAMSLTAGFCEEFLFRGYFIWALAPWLGWWGAALLSVVLFASGHAYQGWNGVFRTGMVGILLTLTVAIFGSLWPAIVLHALVDLSSGTIAWLALRDGQAKDGMLEAEQPTEVRSPSAVESNPV